MRLGVALMAQFVTSGEVPIDENLGDVVNFALSAPLEEIHLLDQGALLGGVELVHVEASGLQERAPAGITEPQEPVAAGRLWHLNSLPRGIMPHLRLATRPSVLPPPVDQWCDQARLETYIEAGRPSDFGFDVFPALLRAGEAIYGYEMGAGEGLWWIDTPENHARVTAQFRDGFPRS